MRSKIRFADVFRCTIYVRMLTTCATLFRLVSATGDAALQIYGAGSPGELVLVEAPFREQHGAGKLVVYHADFRANDIKKTEHSLQLMVHGKTFVLKLSNQKTLAGQFVTANRRAFVKIEFPKPLGTQWLVRMTRPQVDRRIRDLKTELRHD